MEKVITALSKTKTEADLIGKTDTFYGPIIRVYYSNQIEDQIRIFSESGQILINGQQLMELAKIYKDHKPNWENLDEDGDS